IDRIGDGTNLHRGWVYSLSARETENIILYASSCCWDLIDIFGVLKTPLITLIFPYFKKRRVEGENPTFFFLLYLFMIVGKVESVVAILGLLSEALFVFDIH
ncbi:hypothetical protein ACJX0J_034393, partial [Zea mays]